jgi:hypothetical protein
MNNNENKPKKCCYIIKDIPPKTWRAFKIKILQDEMNTYNECLLKLIDNYTQGKISV